MTESQDLEVEAVPEGTALEDAVETLEEEQLEDAIDELALLQEELAEWGAMYAGDGFPPSYSILGNVRISNVEELEGVKLRAVGGTASLLEAAGAIPVFLSPGEMYEALESIEKQAGNISVSEIIDIATNAIAKARGEGES